MDPVPRATHLADLWVAAVVDGERARVPWLRPGLDDPFDVLFELAADEPPRALDVVLLVLERHGQRLEVRERVAAGPLQSLVRDHGREVIDALESATPRVPGLRETLDLLIDAKFDDDVRRRIGVLRG